MMKHLVSFSNSSQSAPSENSGNNIIGSSNMAQKPKRKGCYVCGCILLVPAFLLIIVVIGSMLPDPPATGKSGNQPVVSATTESKPAEVTKASKPVKAKTEPVWQSDGSAYFYSEEFVKRGLKSPSTAKFPDYVMGVPDMSVIQVLNHHDDTYTVIADVDAQNSFGAMIRSQYVCKLHYSPKTGNWTLISLKFIE